MIFGKTNSSMTSTRDYEVLHSEYDSIPISDVQPRTRCRVLGVIRSVTFPSPQGRGAFYATVSDDSGAIEIVWLGRTDVAGIRPGGFIVANGMVSQYEGALAILNPEYRLVSAPN